MGQQASERYSWPAGCPLQVSALLSIGEATRSAYVISAPSKGSHPSNVTLAKPCRTRKAVSDRLSTDSNYCGSSGGCALSGFVERDPVPDDPQVRVRKDQRRRKRVRRRRAAAKKTTHRRCCA